MALIAQHDSDNEPLQLALRFVEETSTHLFLTGKAGTGKTTFLRYLQQHSAKRMVVAAPTGVAAINAGGVTLHSLFQLPFGPFIPTTEGGGTDEGESPASSASGRRSQFKMSKEKVKLLRSLDLVVIDEISMVRADLLDAVDDTLRRYRNKSLPFGGVQLLMIGDLQQLPPVAKEEEWELLGRHYDSPYFFSSKALRQSAWVTIELEKVYRQSDAAFIHLLNRIRDNRIDTAELDQLNRQVRPAFTPPDDEHYILLTTHNAKAQQVNDARLKALRSRSGHYSGIVTGEFPDYLFPTEAQLLLKEGAQVMFVRNDPSPEKSYFNGKLGVVRQLDDETVTVYCPEDQSTIEVRPVTWENRRYTIDPETHEIVEETIGSFVQIPLRTAWAITIHKSQGLTFDRAILDINRSFAHGQVYVALSRCRSLEGLVLTAPLRRHAVISDPTLLDFSRRTDEAPSPQSLLEEATRAYYFTLAREQFDFSALRRAYYFLRKPIQEYLSKLYTTQAVAWFDAQEAIARMYDIADRFQMQLAARSSLPLAPADDPALQERFAKGAAYFLEIVAALKRLPNVALLDIDNKEGKKLLKDSLERFATELYGKEKTLERLIAENAFRPLSYLSAKHQALFEAPQIIQTKRSRKTKATLFAEAQDDAPTASKSTGKASSSAPARKESTAPATAPHSPTSSGSTAGTAASLHSPTPSAADPAAPYLTSPLYEALRGWRAQTARDLGVPAYVVLSQAGLISLTAACPGTPHELLALKGIGKATVHKYAPELLAIIAEHSE